jgi:hypothetical protein
MTRAVDERSREVRWDRGASGDFVRNGGGRSPGNQAPASSAMAHKPRTQRTLLFQRFLNVKDSVIAGESMRLAFHAPLGGTFTVSRLRATQEPPVLNIEVEPTEQSSRYDFWEGLHWVETRIETDLMSRLRCPPIRGRPPTPLVDCRTTSTQPPHCPYEPSTRWAGSWVGDSGLATASRFRHFLCRPFVRTTRSIRICGTSTPTQYLPMAIQSRRPCRRSIVRRAHRAAPGVCHERPSRSAQRHLVRHARRDCWRSCGAISA